MFSMWRLLPPPQKNLAHFGLEISMCESWQRTSAIWPFGAGNNKCSIGVETPTIAA
jgi:hypothetical protein